MIKEELENVVELKNIKFKYTQDSEWIVNDLTLNFKKGEHVCMLGHNGSGKSTLSKLMCGLEVANEGEVKIAGMEMTRANLVAIRKEISIVFQNPDNQFIGATVEDDMAFGLENRCVPQNEMEETIHSFARKVGMFEFLNNEPQKLSGGQKQRVAIGSVLAIAPSIIVFDESTSMLDPKGKKEVNDLILKMAKEDNITIIAITHDMDEAMNADRVIVLEKGKVVLDGKPTEVFQDEAKLKQLKLDLPFAQKVSRRLNDAGIDCDANSIEEVVACL